MPPPPPPRVGCVVSFRHEQRHFVEHVLRETSKFSAATVVVYAVPGPGADCGNVFHDTLQRVKEQFPTVKFTPHNPHAQLESWHALADAPELNNRWQYWPNRARWEGVQALGGDDCAYVMFLEADEVPEGDRVKAFLARALAAPTNLTPAIRFASWSYMREPTLRYRGVEETVVLVPRHRVASRDAVVLCEGGRPDLAAPPVSRSVTDGSPAPMFHSYAFVGTPRDMVQTVRMWATVGRRTRERDWNSSVLEELSRPIVPGHVDVILGRMYESVHNKFGVVLVQ